MSKKTYECRTCQTMFQVDEKEKEPRCTACGGRDLAAISEEELQALLNPARCASR
jgi:DNA-directed RNA polymerase subunit RPC12/RpoP